MAFTTKIHPFIFGYLARPCVPSNPFGICFLVVDFFLLLFVVLVLSSSCFFCWSFVSLIFFLSSRPRTGLATAYITWYSLGPVGCPQTVLLLIHVCVHTSYGDQKLRSSKPIRAHVFAGLSGQIETMGPKNPISDQGFLVPPSEPSGSSTKCKMMALRPQLRPRLNRKSNGNEAGCKEEEC